ncbi:unnamed protein product [Orchesella dallaii]|uniref:Chromatin target of PRMT1 protein C-terminal domain-containing protein n=1 Tax=Orchesella dallaii TaxID=48710 RepID=A0ABP1QQN3_9HEXA
MAVSRTVLQMSTGIPLSERFKQNPPAVEVAESQSPFRRMNFGVNSNRSVTRGFGFNLDDDLTAPSAPRTLRRPTQKRSQGFGFGSDLTGAQNNANLLAIKEAEIRRLRAQLRVTKAHLIIAMSHQDGRLKQDHSVLRSSAFKGGAGSGFVAKRAGGGILFGNRGRRLNLISNKKASALFKRSRPGISPMNRNAAAGTKSVGLNFFGEPRSKEDLDDELEAYMSKSKGKVKNNLDQELDDYMKVARQQSFAAKIGLSTSAAVPTSSGTAEIDGDAAMEEV